MADDWRSAPAPHPDTVTSPPSGTEAFPSTPPVAAATHQVQPGQVQPGQVQPGQVQPGQFQPGQLQPGQLQPGGSGQSPAFSPAGPPGQPWAPQPRWGLIPALPQQPTSYPRFFRTARWRWWLGLLLAVSTGVGFFIVSSVPVLIAMGIDIASGRSSAEDLMKELSQGELPVTPAVFLANNVGLALLIPTTMLLAWAFTGQRPRWLSSVVGRLRWRWLLTVAALIAPVWLIYAVVAVRASWSELAAGPDTVVLIIGIIVTQPVQAAGEEYLFRGLLPRIVGGWIKPEKVALVLGWLTSSVLFMLVHGAGDIYLNIFYFLFASIASWATWRTGGLEASIAIHVVNNLCAMVTVPFTDIAGLFDRDAGSVKPGDIVPVAVCLVVAVVVIEVMARRRKPERSGPVPAHLVSAPEQVPVTA